MEESKATPPWHPALSPGEREEEKIMEKPKTASLWHPEKMVWLPAWQGGLVGYPVGGVI